MDEVKKLLQTAHADAKALEADLAVELDRLRAHIAGTVERLGFDPSALELTPSQEETAQDQAAA